MGYPGRWRSRAPQHPAQVLPLGPEWARLAIALAHRHYVRPDMNSGWRNVRNQRLPLNGNVVLPAPKPSVRYEIVTNNNEGGGGLWSEDLEP